jgi:hypothetical protein
MRIRLRKQVTIGPLWLGVHEAAHAIARLALDETLPFRGQMLSYVTIKADGDQLGKVQMQPRLSPFIPRHILPDELVHQCIRNARCDMIETLAGQAAEARHRHGRTYAMVCEAEVISRILTIDPASGTTDSHTARSTLDWLAPDDPTAELRRLWHRTILLVEIDFPGIVAMARMLCTSGEIDGELFENAWRGHRPSEPVRLKRAKTLDGYIQRGGPTSVELQALTHGTGPFSAVNAHPAEIVSRAYAEY